MTTVKRSYLKNRNRNTNTEKKLWTTRREEGDELEDQD